MARQCETGYGFGTGRNYNYSIWEDLSLKARRTKEFYHLPHCITLEKAKCVSVFQI